MKSFFIILDCDVLRCDIGYSCRWLSMFRRALLPSSVVTIYNITFWSPYWGHLVIHSVSKCEEQQRVSKLDRQILRFPSKNNTFCVKFCQFSLLKEFDRSSCDRGKEKEVLFAGLSGQGRDISLEEEKTSAADTRELRSWASSIHLSSIFP
jgi:hypothetical protein